MVEHDVGSVVTTLAMARAGVAGITPGMPHPTWIGLPPGRIVERVGKQQAAASGCDWGTITTDTQAYQIQREVGKVLQAGKHGRVVGTKIGCTTKVMQDFMGIAHPCAGQ